MLHAVTGKQKLRPERISIRHEYRSEAEGSGGQSTSLLHGMRQTDVDDNSGRHSSSVGHALGAMGRDP